MRRRKKLNCRATELEWLRYFYDHADFGPAHEDVLEQLKEMFEEDTGKKLPFFYNEEEE